MQARHHPLVVLVLGLLLSALAMIASVRIAAAHGDAHWIEENRRYVDRHGSHCCGVDDCTRRQAVYFREAPEGVWVATGAGGEVLMGRELVGRGLYHSIDDDWWICVRGGEIRCVFKPTSGG